MLFLLLYGGAAVTALILCLYLALGRSNAIAPAVTPPARLRRWTAALFGITALGHTWWFLAYLYSGYEKSWAYVVCSVLDCVTLTVTFAGTMLSMLQDRHHPIWPWAAATLPSVVLGTMQIVWPDIDVITPINIYTITLYVFFTVYAAVAVRQYKRWLRDNYADLERKEVWVSHALLIVVLLLFINYGFVDEKATFVIRLTDFLLFALLLWRVETLPQLEEASEHEEDSLPGQDPQSSPIAQSTQIAPIAQSTQIAPSHASTEALGEGRQSHIAPLLEKHCEAAQLYLQQDLTLRQLSAAIGINRTYLGQYFASQGTAYYNYIHDLRIRHFERLCREAVAAGRDFTAQQLSLESGYHNYSTFATAFKQRMGQSVNAWLQEFRGGVKNACDSECPL